MAASKDVGRMNEMRKAYNNIWSRWGYTTHLDTGWQKWQDYWFYKRFNLTEDSWRNMLKNKTVIELGTGAGAFIRNLVSAEQVYGLDLSEEGIKIAGEAWCQHPNVHLVQCDLMKYESELKFDIVIADQMLHHVCPDTFQALKKAVSIVKKNGEILFYVYRRKNMVREAVDTYFRMFTMHLPVSLCLMFSRFMTEAGRILSKINLHLQRTIYWNIAKCFWNPSYLYENNLRNNFDWYHPLIVNRHTVDEVKSWCRILNLTIQHLDVIESGISVRAVKTGEAG